MQFKRRHFYLLLATALILGSAFGPAAADQKTSVTIVMSNFVDGAIYGGQKTADIGSSFHKCQPGEITSCVNTDGQISIPKNIGNVLCLPSGTNNSVESACQGLLNNGSGNCQSNSAASSCESGMIAIAPACNYRTNTDASRSGNWQWLLTKSGTGGVTIGCNQFGYTGPNPK